VSRSPGLLDTPQWKTIDEANCSADGATGVIFVNTKSGGYVVKASDAPVREMFATELALKLNVPAARQSCCSQQDKSDIVSCLSLLSHAAAKAQHTGAVMGEMEGMLAIHVKLWSVFNQRQFVTAIELISGAELLCGMATERAATLLDSSTEGGVKRLSQIGELICLDAFLNNNDRIPVVHSNVGNGRNVMFGNHGNESEDVVAIDQVVSCFHCKLLDQAVVAGETKTDTELSTCRQEDAEVVEEKSEEEDAGSLSGVHDDCRPACKLRAEGGTLEKLGHHATCVHLSPSSSSHTSSSSSSSSSSSHTSSMSDVTARLYGEYVDRVDRWLRSCLQYENADSKQKSFLRQVSVHEELGKVPAQLQQQLLETYQFTERIAEAVVRVSGFEPGTAHMIVAQPAMLEYCKRRGPRVCAEGSLLGVRDFIVRQCGYDVGEDGVSRIREGVCSLTRKIAELKPEEMLSLRESVAAMMKASELQDTNTSDWRISVMKEVNLEYLSVMQRVFSSAVVDVDPAPSAPTLRTKSGNEVYTDQVTGRLYKYDMATRRTSWVKESEEESEEVE